MLLSEKVPGHVVGRLADPLDVLPLSHALHRLAQLVEGEEHYLYSVHEDVAPRYRDVSLVQGLEGIAILIGAGFVAAQSMLARTFAAVRRIDEMEVLRLAGGVDLPRRKVDLFLIAAHDRNGVSDIQGINALANYFKHSSEWPYNWSELNGPLELETARTVIRLGLTPCDPDNMFKGADFLGFGGRSGLSRLGMRVQEWREAIEKEIRKRLRRKCLLELEDQ